MKTIWKYQLEMADEQTLKMPAGAQILTAQVQSGTLCLWAMVDPDAPLQERTLEIFGTGNPIGNTPRRYISSVQMFGGAAVFHVFERAPKSGSPNGCKLSDASGRLNAS